MISFKFPINFEVEWLDTANSNSFDEIPQPSSTILINFFPPYEKEISIFFEFASKEFSINSFTAAEGLSITSPAEIRFIDEVSNFFIDFLKIKIFKFQYM